MPPPPSCTRFHDSHVDRGQEFFLFAIPPSSIHHAIPIEMAPKSLCNLTYPRVVPIGQKSSLICHLCKKAKLSPFKTFIPVSPKVRCRRCPVLTTLACPSQSDPVVQSVTTRSILATVCLCNVAKSALQNAENFHLNCMVVFF